MGFASALEGFTDEAKDVLELAEIRAREKGQAEVGTEHLLAALLKDDRFKPRLVTGVLRALDVNLQLAPKDFLDGLPSDDYLGARERPANSDLARVIKASVGIAAARSLDIEAEIKEPGTLPAVETNSTDLLLALLQEDVDTSEAQRFLAANKVTYQGVLWAAEHPGQAVPQDGKSPIEQFTRNLSTLASKGLLDPVIGRDDEIQRIMNLLHRRNKSIALIGEAGVGKTAIAELLALRIRDGDVPVELENKQVLALDIPGILAGTKYRGEFEERFKAFIDAIKAEPGKRSPYVLLIDEMHTMVSAGSVEGNAVDVANLLKPAIARGEIQVIGATTLREYRTYIEKDAALERRFQPIYVEEPSPEDTLEILKGMRETFESFYSVSVSDAVLATSVKLAKRYVTGRNFPDKAIDLIDEACARHAAIHGTPPSELRERRAKIAQLEQQLLTESSRKNHFTLVGHVAALRAKHASDKEVWLAQRGESRPELSKDDIAAVVHDWTRIPVSHLTGDDRQRIREMPAVLKSKIFGQDDAVDIVCDKVKAFFTEMNDPERPIASYIFQGDTAVGKTALAEALAEFLCGTKDALLRYDMGEFMQKQNLARLVGSPPGFVGYDEPGQLTEDVRQRPFSVVLFDEIEKAHTDFQNMLLSILDHGMLTDAKGVSTNFRNAVIIMTSNSGIEQLSKPTMGFETGDPKANAAGKNQKKLQDAFEEWAKRELIHRLDGVVPFKQLTVETGVTASVQNKFIDAVAQRCAAKGLELRVGDEVRAMIASEAQADRDGARRLRNLIEKKIVGKISAELLEQDVQAGDVVDVTLVNGVVMVTIGPAVLQPVVQPTVRQRVRELA